MLVKTDLHLLAYPIWLEVPDDTEVEPEVMARNWKKMFLAILKNHGLEPPR